MGLTPYKKPQKECVEYILSNFKNITKEKTVMVGNTIIDLQTAKNSGIDMIGVSYGIDGEETLKNNGCLNIMKDFSKILQFIN